MATKNVVKECELIRKADSIYRIFEADNKKFLAENPHIKPTIDPDKAKKKTRETFINEVKKFKTVIPCEHS